MTALSSDWEACRMFASVYAFEFMRATFGEAQTRSGD
jgi:hypothetical protein